MLENLDWLNNLSSLGSFIDITNNSLLTNINGLSNLINFNGRIVLAGMNH